MLNIILLTALQTMQPHYSEAMVLTTVPAELLEDGGCDNYDTYQVPALDVSREGDAEDITL